MLTIATLNVNGIRAAFRKGLANWLDERQPDVLLLQETRAPADVVEQALSGWHVAACPSEQKGQSGVAIASRLPLASVRRGLAAFEETGQESPRDSGRWLEADVLTGAGPVTVVSTYLHSATNTPEMAHTMAAKYRHLDKVEQRLGQLINCETPVVIGGDLNIAHQNCDLANWRGNQNNAGFLPEERAYLSRWFGSPDDGDARNQGWTDLAREYAGDTPGPYTWWTYRGRAFTNDVGWRLDYQLGNTAAAKAMRSVVVDKQPAFDQRYSDHAPVVAYYQFGEQAAPN